MPELRLRVAKIYEDQGEWLKAGNVYKAFWKKPPAGAGFFVYFARLLRSDDGKTEPYTERTRVYNETVKLFKKQKADLPERQPRGVRGRDDVQVGSTRAWYLELRITGARRAQARPRTRPSRRR